MKRVLFITILLLLTYSTINSQESKPLEEKKTVFGITVGFNQNYQTSSPYNLDGLNIYAGFFVKRNISERFALQLELIHTKPQGSGYNVVEFPIFLKYNLNNKLSFYSGVQLNLSYEDVFNKEIYSQKPGDFAFNFGLNYNLSSKWFLDLRFIHNPDKFIFSGQNVRNNTIRLGVGYRF